MATRCVFALLVLVAGVPLAYSKDSPDLILISGGGLNQPVEITDPASLKAFDPWMGQFANWQQKPLVDAPCFEPVASVTYEVFTSYEPCRRVSVLSFSLRPGHRSCSSATHASVQFSIRESRPSARPKYSRTSAPGRN